MVSTQSSSFSSKHTQILFSRLSPVSDMSTFPLSSLSSISPICIYTSSLPLCMCTFISSTFDEDNLPCHAFWNSSALSFDSILYIYACHSLTHIPVYRDSWSCSEKLENWIQIPTRGKLKKRDFSSCPCHLLRFSFSVTLDPGFLLIVSSVALWGYLDFIPNCGAGSVSGALVWGIWRENSESSGLFW